MYSLVFSIFTYPQHRATSMWQMRADPSTRAVPYQVCISLGVRTYLYPPRLGQEPSITTPILCIWIINSQNISDAFPTRIWSQPLTSERFSWLNTMVK